MNLKVLIWLQRIFWLFGWTVLGTVTTLVVLVLPKWWNYRTLLGSRGFPSAEPIGAYTVGSYGGMNRLSLVGR